MPDSRSEIHFLGFVCSQDGIASDLKKVQVINMMSRPKDVKGCLGAAGFFHRYIFNFAKIAAPFTNLTRKSVKFS